MTRTQTKETLSPMKSIPKLDLPHKNKTPLKQIQAPQPQPLPKAVTPNKKTPRPTLSKTPSKTDFKQPRPQTSTAGEAIANSVKRLYAGNSKTDSQPDGKVSSKLLNERVN